MQKPQNKILFISQYAGFIGGLEKYMHSLSLLLRENGFNTCALYVEKTNRAEEFLSGFDGHKNFSEMSDMSADDYGLVTMHKISRPDVLEKILAKFSPTTFVHDHDYFCPKGYKYYPYKRINCARAHNALVCGICSSIVPPRHITNGIWAMLKKNFVESTRLCGLVKICPQFVVLSDFMKRELIANGIAEEKIKILHPWIKAAANPVQKSEGGKIKLVFAGQQVMSKGIPLLLEAAKLFKCDYSLDILGAGGRLEDFRKISENMGLKDRVFFRGWVSDTAQYFEKAHIALFPSMWQEPFGLTGIEAMNAHTPVVGFDVGGVGEWLKDGFNGILVKERDTTAMAAAVDKLAADRPLRLKLGENAAKYVAETYVPETFMKNFRTQLLRE